MNGLGQGAGDSFRMRTWVRILREIPCTSVVVLFEVRLTHFGSFMERGKIAKVDIRPKPESSRRSHVVEPHHVGDGPPYIFDDPLRSLAHQFSGFTDELHGLNRVAVVNITHRELLARRARPHEVPLRLSDPPGQLPHIAHDLDVRPGHDIHPDHRVLPALAERERGRPGPGEQV